MKKYLIFLFVMLVASQSFGQQEEKKDSSDVKTDSPGDALTKDGLAQPAAEEAATSDTLVKPDSPATNKLAQSPRADTLNKVAVPPVEHKKGQPAVMYSPYTSYSSSAGHGDSLIRANDSLTKALNKYHLVYRDTVSALKREISELNAKIKNLTADDAVREKLINELKQLKSLFDSGILTRTEFDMMKIKVLEKLL